MYACVVAVAEMSQRTKAQHTRPTQAPAWPKSMLCFDAGPCRRALGRGRGRVCVHVCGHHQLAQGLRRGKGLAQHVQEPGSYVWAVVLSQHSKTRHTEAGDGDGVAGVGCWEVHDAVKPAAVPLKSEVNSTIM